MSNVLRPHKQLLMQETKEILVKMLNMMQLRKLKGC